MTIKDICNKYLDSQISRIKNLDTKKSNYPIITQKAIEKRIAELEERKERELKRNDPSRNN